MNDPISYRLPWPPSVNNYWGSRVAKSGGRSIVMPFLTAKARDFRTAVKEIVGNCKPTGARLAVSIELIAPTRRACDVDNFCKSTLDALMHAGVFEDDSQIDELRVKRLHVEAPGACDVTIIELPSTKPVQGTLLEQFNSMTAEKF